MKSGRRKNENQRASAYFLTVGCIFSPVQKLVGQNGMLLCIILLGVNHVFLDMKTVETGIKYCFVKWSSRGLLTLSIFLSIPCNLENNSLMFLLDSSVFEDFQDVYLAGFVNFLLWLAIFSF